jgi:3',5'-cyclic AMP phosphodiesterase CpdA
MVRIWLLAGLALTLAGCAGDRLPFRGDALKGPVTHTRFQDAPGDFAFAVVSDLESGYRPGVFEVAMSQLDLMRPGFILTVGDMIEGGTEDERELVKEWDAFDARLKAQPAPFFHVAGNHDLTNLSQRKVWEARYGRRYSWFVYKDVMFLLLDSEDYSPAEMTEIYKQRADMLTMRKTDPAAAAKLPYASRLEAKVGEISPEQSAYFEAAIKANPGVRWTFVLMHKPVWQREDDLGLKRIEAALGSRGYTVLNGHLHRYAYSKRNGRDYIMLGTTGGERGFDGSAGALDHFMWVTMTKDGPSIANLRLDGVLDKQIAIPADGAKLCLDWGKPPCPPASPPAK